MTTELRKLLGARMRHNLAIEEIVNGGDTAVATNEDTTVVMKGPLADVYSDALSVVYDKEGGNNVDPVATGEVNTTDMTPVVNDGQDTIETAVLSEVKNVVTESQAIDAAVAQSLANAMADAPPEGATDYQTLYAVDETQVKAEDVKDVTAILAAAESPENVTVLIDNVVPNELAVKETSELDVEKAKELATSLESMVISLGGKVVRSYKDFVTQEVARRHKK